MHSPLQRYSRWQIGLHWLIVALIIVVYLLIEWHDLLPKGSPERALAKTWHEMIGLLVFGLAFVRIILRLTLPEPPIQPPLPYWQHILARAIHIILYLWLFTMPLLGWLYLSTKATPIPFFGLQLPALTGPDANLATTIKSLHVLLGNIGYALIGAHAVAALYHHYVLHDNTLERMLPTKAPNDEAS